MRSRFKLLGHPAHPIMVVFPLALYPLAGIMQIIYLVLIGIFNQTNAAKVLTFDVGFFWRAGFLLLLVGILTNLAAALPGLIDWLNIPNDAPSKDKATFHMIIGLLTGGVSTMALLLLNWGEPPANIFKDSIPQLIGVFLTLVVGMMLVNYQGWLGGELVYKHGIGVEQTDDIDPIAVTPGSEALQDNL